MMQELIDRQAALKNICKYCAEAKCKKNECMVFAGIKDTPIVEPEVRNGRWIQTTLKGYYECSACRYEHTSNPDQRFCSYCGAKMDLRTPTEVQLDEADDVMMGG